MHNRMPALPRSRVAAATHRSFPALMAPKPPLRAGGWAAPRAATSLRAGRLAPARAVAPPRAAISLRARGLGAGLAAGLALALAMSLAFAEQAGAQAQAGTTLSGGAVAGEPPKPGPREAPGSKARLTRTGLAIPPADAPPAVKKVIRAGNRIAKKPYKWGGGHGRLRDSGYDCSGSISFTLRKARLMSSSLASTGFMSWGRRGTGRWITIRANPGHAYMVVAGLRFDTSARKQTGSRWTREMRSPRGYRATHPPRL